MDVDPDALTAADVAKVPPNNPPPPNANANVNPTQRYSIVLYTTLTLHYAKPMPLLPFITLCKPDLT